MVSEELGPTCPKGTHTSSQPLSLPTSRPCSSDELIIPVPPGGSNSWRHLGQHHAVLDPPTTCRPQVSPWHHSAWWGEGDLGGARGGVGLPPPTPQTLTRAASPAGPWPRPVALSCSGPWHWQLPRLEDS